MASITLIDGSMTTRRVWLRRRLREMIGAGAGGILVLGGARTALAASATCPVGEAGRNNGWYQYYCCVCVNGSCMFPAGGMQSIVPISPLGCNSPGCVPRTAPPSKQMPTALAAREPVPPMLQLKNEGGSLQFDQLWGFRKVHPTGLLSDSFEQGIPKGKVPDAYEPAGLNECGIKLVARVKGKENKRPVAAQLMLGSRQDKECGFGKVLWMIAHEISTKDTTGYTDVEFVPVTKRVYRVDFEIGPSLTLPFHCVMEE